MTHVLTPDQMAWSLTSSYRLMFIGLAVAILVELICFRRVRNFNAWLALLAGPAVFLQTYVMLTSATLTWDQVEVTRVSLELNMLGYSGVALVAVWFGARRVWLDRLRSRPLMAWLRAAALALLTWAFLHQLAWGQEMLDLLATARHA